MAHKTKKAALDAARAALSEHAVEGIDFNLRNTGAGWTFEEIPPANAPAREARRAIVERGGRQAGKTHATKTNLLIAMMRRPEGATSKAMEEATSWAPHSVRGLIGALKAKGTPVVSHKAPGSRTVYRISDVGDVL